MEYVVQALKVLRNLVHVKTNARCPKTVLFCRFPNSNSISLRDSKYSVYLINTQSKFVK